MSIEHVQKNGIGIKFLATIVEDGALKPLQSATVKKMLFKKPSGATLEKTAEFETDGSDGKIYYITVAGDLDESGARWEVQGYVVYSGVEVYSEKKGFIVGDNILAVS